MRKRDRWLLAVALGLIGFVLNLFPLTSGWGLEFLLGGAAVYAALRVLNPMQIAVAGSLSAAATIWTWHHPWAWLIWTVEAAVLASMPKRHSPVRQDVVFWVLAGAPLLWLTYGQLMAMDGSSLALLIVKHSINGVLNVTLGELIYTGTLIVWGQRARRRFPPVSIDSAILALMVSIATVPAVLWLGIDAPHREGWLRSLAASRLTEGYHEVERTLWDWRDKQTAKLVSLASDDGGKTGTSPTLSPVRPGEFEATGIMVQSGRRLRPADPGAAAIGTLGPLATAAVREPVVMVEQQKASGRQPRLVLAVPIPGGQGNRFIVGTLREDTFDRLVRPVAGTPGLTALFLIAPDGRIGGELGDSDAPWLRDAAARSVPDGQTVEASPPREFGTPPMNAQRDIGFVTARASQALPGWKVVLVSRARAAILEERLTQSRILNGLAAMIVLLTILASVLAHRSRVLLERMAQSLTDLAILGGRREHIQGALIAELGDIANRISIAGTQMHKQRKDLITNRRRLEVIIQHGGLVIYTLDVSGPSLPTLKFMTPNVKDLFGYGPDEVGAVEWRRDYLHPDDQAEPPLTHANLRPGEVVVREYRVRHWLGHYVWIHDCLVIDKAEDGSVEGVGFLIDISERKATNEKLIQASKMESLGRMAAGVAHELNQPLNFISLASQNLHKRLSSGKVDPVYAIDKIERILSQVRRAALIVGQVRTFGRSSTEAAEIVDVADVVADVASLLKGQLDLKGIKLRYDRVDPAMRVRIHPVRLGQVLINLVINARDSILERMETGDSPAMIVISTCQHLGSAEIAVEDTGTGIAADKLALLFEPFFTTKSPKEGTGLGLSVSYGIIAEAGGTIRAENASDGARFVISLPAPGPLSAAA